MKRGYKIAIIIILTLSFLIFLPKKYAYSGTIAGLPKDKECGCLGVKYDYYPKGCADCATEYFCGGIVYNCRTLCYEKNEFGNPKGKEIPC